MELDREAVSRFELTVAVQDLNGLSRQVTMGQLSIRVLYYSFAYAYFTKQMKSRRMAYLGYILYKLSF